MHPKISIIIATLNASNTLEKCLESIVGQRSKLIELLVVDGGSIDGTRDILHNYEQKIDVTVSENDKGIYDAWNKGILISNTDWILFIGADDVLETDAIANYLNFLDRNDTSEVDYISAKNIYVGHRGKELKIIGMPWSWHQFRRSMQVAHVASLHKRSLFKEVGLFDLSFKICGDYELLLRKKNLLNCLFLDACIARMAIGGASYSVAALRESHRARKIHSGFSSIALSLILLWQTCLFVRHRYLNRNR